MNQIAFAEDLTLSNEEVWARRPIKSVPLLSVVADPEPEPVRLSVSREPEWLPMIVEKINYLLALPEDWDSYGAKRINEKAALNTLKLLLSVMEEKTPFPSIVPISSGDLQVEWHVFGINLEIAIDPHGYQILDGHDRTFPIKDIEACLKSVLELTDQAINERQG